MATENDRTESAVGTVKEHPLWDRWRGMKERCANPKHVSYPHYGAKGITVCKKWRDDFRAFARDVGLPPTPDHQLDRIDPDKGYAPDNVQWATASWQRWRSDATCNLFAVLLIRAVSGSHEMLADALGLPVHTVRDIALRRTFADLEETLAEHPQALRRARQAFDAEHGLRPY